MNERSEADRLAAALELPGEAEGSGTPTGEFADLVQLSRRLTQAAPPSLAEAQRQAMRRRVLASRAAEAPHRLLSPAWPRWQRRLALAAVIVALAVLTGGGALRASAESVPGQPLYGLKRAQEQTHVALAFSGAAKATAYADAAAHRIQEVHQLTGHGDPQVVRALASQAAQDIGHAGQFAGRPDAMADTGLQRRVQALQREQQALPVPSASPNATPLAGVTVSPQPESTPTASPAPGPAPGPTQLPLSTVPTASPAPTPSPVPGPTPSPSRTAPTASATPVPSPAPPLSSTPTAPTVSPAPAALAGSTSAPSVATAPAAPPSASPLASPRPTATNRSSPTTSAREQSTTRRVRSSGQIPPAQTPGVTSTPLPR